MPMTKKAARSRAAGTTCRICRMLKVLKTTAAKSVSSARPLRMAYPTGCCIQPLAVRIQIAERLLAPATSHITDRVRLARKLLPAEDPDADQRGLQEKGRGGFDGQQRAEDVAHVGRVPRPVGAELELQRDAGDDPHGKVDQEKLAPELGHLEVGFVAGARVLSLHDRDQHRQPQRQRDEEKVENRGRGELQPRKQQDVHLLGSFLQTVDPTTRPAGRRRLQRQ